MSVAPVVSVSQPGSGVLCQIPGDKEFVSWQPDLEESVKPSQQARPTVIRWADGGKEVFISGSFNNWSTKIPLIKRWAAPQVTLRSLQAAASPLSAGRCSSCSPGFSRLRMPELEVTNTRPASPRGGAAVVVGSCETAGRDRTGHFVFPAGCHTAAALAPEPCPGVLQFPGSSSPGCGLTPCLAGAVESSLTRLPAVVIFLLLCNTSLFFLETLCRTPGISGMGLSQFRAVVLPALILPCQHKFRCVAHTALHVASDTTASLGMRGRAAS